MKQVVLFLMLLLYARVGCAQQDYIAIITADAAGAYTEAIAGFRTELTRAGITCPIITSEIPWQPSATQRPILIVTVGTKATEYIAKTITNVPVVYTMVIQRPNPQPNMTGVSLEISPLQQLKLGKRIMPNLTRVGLLYNPIKTNDVAERSVRQARELDLQIVSAHTTALDQVYHTIRTLRPRIEALLMIPDTTVYNSQTIKDILLYALRERLAIIGMSQSYVKAGALCAISCNYTDIGRQTANLALRVINGTPPSQMPPEEPEHTEISLNLHVAQRLEITVPASVIEEATHVYQ